MPSLLSVRLYLKITYCGTRSSLLFCDTILLHLSHCQFTFGKFFENDYMYYNTQKVLSNFLIHSWH